MPITLSHFAPQLAAALWLTATAALALDLTPEGTFKEIEGSKIPLVHFSDGKRKIDFMPPPGWRLSGGGKALNLYPGTSNESQVQILLVDYKKPAPPKPGEPEPPDDLQTWVLRFLSTGSTKVHFIRENPSPYTLEGWPSREFIFTCTRLGIQESVSISVVDRTETQRVAVVVSAPTKDFEPIRQQAIGSMSGWRISPAP